ncbi:hypothetical protein ABY42_18810 (plasmid) [Haloferax gibbonsii]|uniref:Uncharacterized protein n=1 Tax=Haloferax gibbonsii TaxID=35746 RepID=A0A0K1IZZ1_HALGI|nr:hypothetical protein ABY42_18810 [Haloferax gibbonsii]
MGQLACSQSAIHATKSSVQSDELALLVDKVVCAVLLFEFVFRRKNWICCRPDIVDSFLDSLENYTKHVIRIIRVDCIDRTLFLRLWWYVVVVVCVVCIWVAVPSTRPALTSPFLKILNIELPIQSKTDFESSSIHDVGIVTRLKSSNNTIFLSRREVLDGIDYREICESTTENSHPFFVEVICASHRG